MPTPSYPDAVMLPVGLIGGNAGEQLNKLKRIFSPVLDCQRVASMKTPFGTFICPFVRADGSTAPLLSPNYPIGHPRERAERLTWFVITQDKTTRKWTQAATPCVSASDSPGTVKAGYLKEDTADADDGLVDSVAGPIAVESAPAVAPVVKAPAFAPASPIATEK